VRFAEAATAGQPLEVYAPDNPNARAFRELAEEVITYAKTT